jgi:catechol 2,3-dioxygenase-like lactoylglutathione lyase family enzyme
MHVLPGPRRVPGLLRRCAGDALFAALAREYRLGRRPGVEREEVVTVFEDARGAAVVAAADLERARSFYENVLGLTPYDENAGAELVFYRLGGVPLLVYRSGFAGTAQNTVFALDTDDLDRDMATLRERGVVFKDYDFPGLTTVDGVAELMGERSSWFEDSEGNILALSQRV